MVLKRESTKSIAALPSPEEYPKVCIKNLKGFYKWIYKRHKIYRLKSKGKPWPWTQDLILQEYKFTNVYRKLDRTSQWMIRYIIESDDYPRLQDKVWGCLISRINNNLETFDYCGVPLRKEFKPKKFQRKMEEYKAKGNRVFTNAHITCQSNLKRTRIENYIEIVSRLKTGWKEIWKSIKGFAKEEDWEGCFKFIKTLYGFGGFTSYEVCIDMVYAEVFPDSVRDTFANPGPGCEFGIETIYPNRKYISYNDAMRRLTDRQNKYFKKFGLKHKGPKLTIQDIEFALCEWGKYWKIKHGVGKARMRYHHE